MKTKIKMGETTQKRIVSYPGYPQRKLRESVRTYRWIQLLIKKSFHRMLSTNSFLIHLNPINFNHIIQLRIIQLQKYISSSLSNLITQHSFSIFVYMHYLNTYFCLHNRSTLPQAFH